MTGFHVTGSTPLLSSGFLEVTSERIVGPDDATHERTIVRHPGAVCVVPIVGEGSVLMVRQYRVATGGDLVEVPAGRRDVEGELPIETARRELAEEVGLSPDTLVKLGEFWNSPGFCTEYMHCYLAPSVTEIGRSTPIGAEERAMTTVDVRLADIETLVAERQLVDAKSVVALFLARAYLAGSHAGLAD